MLSISSKSLVVIVILGMAGSSLLLRAQTSNEGWRLSGWVVAEDDTPLPGALVSYNRLPKFVETDRPGNYVLAGGEAVVNRTVAAGPDGSFEARDLPAGNYYLCAYLPGGGFLDPCRWEAGPVVTLGQDQPVVGAELRLKRGGLLQVRVNDQQQLLPRTRDPLAAPGLIVGVHTEDGSFHEAGMVSADESSLEFLITVPYERPLKLWLFSRQVRLTDTLGASVDTSGGDTPLVVQLGENKIVTLNVTGPQ